MIEIIALHGFLGMPQDFSLLEEQFDEDKYLWRSLDYTKIDNIGPRIEIQNWASAFLKWQSEHLKTKAEIKYRFILGYSQGGRLALQLLKTDCANIDGVILLSANPGIDQHLRPSRQAHDKAWGKRFVSEDFERAVLDWNQQSVFWGSKIEPRRKKEDFDVQMLALCLQNWGTGMQEDLFLELQNPKIPTLYLVGENDTKYKEIATKLSVHQAGLLKVAEILNAGHRVHLDQPQLTANKIFQFIDRAYAYNRG